MILRSRVFSDGTAGFRGEHGAASGAGGDTWARTAEQQRSAYETLTTGSRPDAKCFISIFGWGYYAPTSPPVCNVGRKRIQTVEDAVIAFELPYPPSLNNYYRHVGGRVLISKSGRNYREAVALAIIAQRVKAAPPGRLSVELDVHPPDNRRRDIDNLCKAMFDAIKHAGVYEDDSLIDYLSVTRRRVIPGGKIIVRIDSWKE